MDFRYKAKVDKKWLKGRSLTDHKEDASEFETESEPTQIINQLKRDGKIAQKAVIKIVKKRESVELNYENIYRESENKVIKTPYGKMQIVDEFVIQDDDKLAFVQKAEEKYKELEKDGWFSFEKTEPYWYAFPYNRAKFTLCANDTDKICFIDYRKEGYDMIYENSDSSQSKVKVEEGLFTPKSWSAKGIEKAKKEKSELEKTPHRYSVHIKNLSAEQLFGLIAMNNTKNDVEFFGFGIVKIDGKFYLYKWQPTECDWAHPRMEMNKLTYESRDIHLCLLSREDFTDEMADDLSHWIESKEPWGTCSGRVFPIFASAASESSNAKYEGIIVFGNDKSSVSKYKKIYEKLTNGKNALPIERCNLSGDISEIPNKFQNGSWLSVSLDPKEIMSLGIGQRDIYDDTLKKNYGEVTINNLHEYKNLGVNMNFRKIYREANSLRKISEAANNSLEAFEAIFQKYFNEDFDRYVRWGKEFDCDEASLLSLICPEGLEDLIVFLPEIVKKEFPWYDTQWGRIEFNSVSAEEFDKLLGTLCYVAQKLEDENAKSKAAWSTDLWSVCNKNAIPQYSEAGERIYDAVSELSILSPEEKRSLYNDWHEKTYRKPTAKKSKKPSKNSVTKEEVFKKVYESDDMIEVDVNDYDNYEALNEVTCYLQDAAWSEFSGYEREDFEDEFPGWFTAHCDFTEYADYESLSDNYGLEEYKGVDPLNRF